MIPTVVFLGDLTLAVLVCTGTVLYLAKHLRLLLIELCGSGSAPTSGWFFQTFRWLWFR